MDIFPELFAGNAGLTGIAFATGTCDIAAGGAGNFGVAELFNPAVANPNTAAQLIQATVVGLIVFNTTAAANFKILKSASPTDVSTAATIPPLWMDGRRTDAALITLKQGTPASIVGTEIMRIPLNTNERLVLPFNYDFTQGLGLNFACDVAIQRFVVTPIWVEHPQTS